MRTVLSPRAEPCSPLMLGPRAAYPMVTTNRAARAVDDSTSTRRCGVSRGRMPGHGAGSLKSGHRGRTGPATGAVDPAGLDVRPFKPLSCVAQLFRSRGVRRPVAQLPTARELALQSTRHRALLALPLDHSRSRRSPRGSVGSRHRALLAFPLDQPWSRWSRLSRSTNHGRDGAYKVCRPDTCTCTHNPRRSWGQDSSIFRCMRLGRVNYRRWVTRPPASNGGKPSCANKWLRAGTETSVDHRTTPPRY